MNQMTHKERVIAAVNKQDVDRVAGSPDPVSFCLLPSPFPTPKLPFNLPRIPPHRTVCHRNYGVH